MGRESDAIVTVDQASEQAPRGLPSSSGVGGGHQFIFKITCHKHQYCSRYRFELFSIHHRQNHGQPRANAPKSRVSSPRKSVSRNESESPASALCIPTQYKGQICLGYGSIFLRNARQQRHASSPNQRDRLPDAKSVLVQYGECVRVQHTLFKRYMVLPPWTQNQVQPPVRLRLNSCSPPTTQSPAQ